MQIQLKYMVSHEDTGLIIGGFNEAKDVMAFCSLYEDPLRITIEGGGIPGRDEYSRCLDVEHNTAESLHRWAREIQNCSIG